jgi:hypothetical protein
VFTGDSGLHSHPLRLTVRHRGFVENIHQTSHASGRNTTEETAKKKNRARWRIEGFPNWRANGHGEVECLCGRPAAETSIRVGVRGQALMAIEGRCKQCGHAAGKYRRDARTKTFALVLEDPAQWRAQEIDLAFGNPLTYNDPLSAAYGNLHHGLIESIHGLLARRFHLNYGKRPISSHAQLRIETAAILGSLHVLADFHLGHPVHE